MSISMAIRKCVRTWAAALAIGAAGLAIIPAGAHAGEAQAKALFKAMSDYLAAQKAISLDYDSFLEIVAHVSKIVIRKPPRRGEDAICDHALTAPALD